MISILERRMRTLLRLLELLPEGELSESAWELKERLTDEDLSGVRRIAKNFPFALMDYLYLGDTSQLWDWWATWYGQKEEFGETLAQLEQVVPYVNAWVLLPIERDGLSNGSLNIRGNGQGNGIWGTESGDGTGVISFYDMEPGDARGSGYEYTSGLGGGYGDGTHNGDGKGDGV
jgi:hypothetical protein